MPGSNGPLPVNHRLYAEIAQFLYHEAELLDARCFSEWLGLMAEDMTYRVPLRDDASRELGTSSTRLDWFDDDLDSLRLRVSRLATNQAYAEMPPSRTRHMITNIRVRATLTANEFDVASNILVYRHRDRNSNDVFCGERQDLLRNTDSGWRLVRRTVILDQCVIGTGSLGIFL